MARRYLFFSSLAAPVGLLGLMLLVGSCGGPPAAPADASGNDAGPDLCTSDDQCDDTVFCNGRERCRPGAATADDRGCVASRVSSCAPTQTCDEMHDRCATQCDRNPDADGDGVTAVECGGTDCDDADPNRFPGNLEVCDAASHDEDCDAATFGARDADLDGVIDARCCNVAADGSMRCGTDCDDLSRDVRPGGTEVCDLHDQDCDGLIDEGVQAAGFVDADRDLHGDGTMPVMGCIGLPGIVATGDDCDDTRPAVHVGAAEICDARDDDCDGTVDEQVEPVTWYRDLDGDGFGSSASGTTVSCAPPTGYSLLGTDCDDARRTTSPLAREACNGIDDDCSGAPDFTVGPGDTEDDDRDGYADPRCGTSSPDCDDRDPDVHPGAPELCNHRDDDCDGMIETTTHSIPWYADRDGDGYGDDASPATYACDQVPGRVERGGDCDDRSIAVSPIALDACGVGTDGFDDDCDGSIDEGGGLLDGYVDRDGDGFGAGTAVRACMLPAGRIAIGGDCDDLDPAIRPSLSESCAVLDLRDDDCDGFVDCEDSDCRGAPLCGPPVSLALVSGDGQSAMAGFPLLAPIVVRATDTTGAPLAGAAVRFHVTPGGYASPLVAVSEADGLARAYVRVGLSAVDYDVTMSANGATPLHATATATTPPDGTWVPLLDADRLGPATSADQTGLVDGASALAARPRSLTPIGGAASVDGLRFVGAGASLRLVIPLPIDDCVIGVDSVGVIHVLAGHCGLGGIDTRDEDGLATDATLDGPTHVALDATGQRLFVADGGNRRIRAIDLASGTIRTIAGGGVQDPPAVDVSVPSGAVAMDATRLAFDPASDELWIGGRGACYRVGIATGVARGVLLCPNDYPHRGLQAEGALTVLATWPLGTSDRAGPPTGLVSGFVTTPFGSIDLSTVGPGVDVTLPPGATSGGVITASPMRTTSTTMDMTLGPTAGPVSFDAWVHPEAGTVHVTGESRATRGQVFHASGGSAAWLSAAHPTVAHVGGDVIFSDATPFVVGTVVWLSAAGFRVVRSDEGAEELTSGGAGTWGGAFQLGATYDERELLTGRLTRRIHGVYAHDGTWPLTRLSDGTLWWLQYPSGGVAMATFAPDGTMTVRSELDSPDCANVLGLAWPYVANGSVVAEADDSVLFAGTACLPGLGGTDAIVRRHPDGTLEHVAFRSDGASTDGGTATEIALHTTVHVDVALDGTIYAFANGVLYLIDPTTSMAAVVTPTGPSLPADGPTRVAVDGSGHFWIASSAPCSGCPPRGLYVIW